MKKIFYILISVLILASCTKDITRFNKETKQASSVPAGALLANSLKNLSDGLANASVNINVWRFTVSHWAMGTYQDEAQYDFSTRDIPQSWWTRMYKDVLNNLKEASRIVKEDAFMDPVVKENKLAILDVLQVYTYSILINTFGDIPYTDATDPNNLFPKYDDAKTVYADLLKRLATDIGKLTSSTSNTSFTSTEDLVYSGKVASWVKFANSLQMKMGMIIADVDDAAAKIAVEAADAGAMSSAMDIGLIKYFPNSPSQNPLYVDIILGKRPDYVAAEDLMKPLINLNDPRKSQFFGVNNVGDYAGGVVGAVNVFKAMSKPSTKVSAADASLVLLDYAQTEFFRAEAKERGYNVAGTAEGHYNNAIKASIIYWGGTSADADTYLAQPEVAYATATGTWKQKIGFQKWIALYNMPYDGWTELRRLDYPVITAPVGAKSGFPNRFPYPSNEQQLNGTNYTAAAAKMGADKVEFKLFWDKF